MTSRGRRLLVGVLACAACAPVSGADAVGPPLPSSATGRAGAVAPGGSERFLTRRAGDDTVVRVVRRSDRRLLRSRRIDGRWTVPAATLEGGTTGLSGDGRVLVLGRPARSVPVSTELAVLDTAHLTVTRRISLEGFFTVDAISPDGTWIYVIQYSSGDYLDYRVRALDARTGRLASRDVVDPREPDERMGGFPMARAMSRDGRWAYTLYLGGDESFIHALDTVGRIAACIDLEMIPPQGDLPGYRLKLTADGRHLDIRHLGDLVATVDTRTFAVSEPGESTASHREPAAARHRSSAAPADGGGFPWWVLLPAAGLCVLVARTVASRAR
jgi:hypothetical protein